MGTHHLEHVKINELNGIVQEPEDPFCHMFGHRKIVGIVPEISPLGVKIG